MIQLIDIVGLTGVMMIVYAYFLLMSGRCHHGDLQYAVLNGIGGVLVLMSVLVNWNLASAVIEVFWIGITLYGYRKANNGSGKSGKTSLTADDSGEPSETS